MDYGHILICGSTMSGKSYVANYLVANHLNSLYDLFLLISGTTDSLADDVFTNIELKNRSKSLSNKVLDYIKDYAVKNPDKKILVILDDLNKLLSISGTKDERVLAKESESNIIHLFTEGRHKNIYTMALVQYYKQLKPVIRSNSRYQIVTFAGNSLADLLYENVDNCFENVKELKLFLREYNIPYKKKGKKIFLQSVMFDCFCKSREIEDCVTILKP